MPRGAREPAPLLHDPGRSDGGAAALAEVRRREARRKAVRCGTLATTSLKLPGVAPTDDELKSEVDGLLKDPETIRGATVRELGKTTELASQPTELEKTLPPKLDIGSQCMGTFLPRRAAGRTTDTYESSLQSRPPAVARFTGTAPGKMMTRKVGLPGGTHVAPIDGKVEVEYTALPTDAYRRLAENGRKHGIGSTMQVRF